MLDDLLGRTELKETIESLEKDLEECTEERERLEGRLEKETNRRKAAVTERQEAQREANKLEDKIEQLEDRIEQLQSDEPSLSYREQTSIRDRKLDDLLHRLETYDTQAEEGALSAYIEDPHDISPTVREVLAERTGLVVKAAPCLLYADDTGVISVCLRPPVAPEPFEQWDQTFRIEREWLQPRERYTLALVRSDLFAMGTYVGDEQLAFHGFDSELKSQHSKGGFSQARFERLRDEQIDDHLERCEAALRNRDTDRLYVVGEGSVLGELDHTADATATVDATGDPEPALEDAWRDFWTVQMRVL